MAVLAPLKPGWQTSMAIRAINGFASQSQSARQTLDYHRVVGLQGGDRECERGHGQSVSGAGPNDVGGDGVRLEMIMLTTVPYQPVLGNSPLQVAA